MVFLEQHNYWRARTNPSGGDIKMLVWDDKLAAVAQEYAEKCVWEHNPKRTEESRPRGRHRGHGRKVFHLAVSRLGF